MSLAPGTRLGSCEITAKLGEGGMGEVYRATDTKLDREVAIKVLPAAFIEDRERLARFEREAKLLAQLNHPNIAQIYGLETSGATHALVMELVPGPTLADRLETGPLPLTESLSFALQIAQALEEAHEKGIVHRDLKPQNIKASSEGKAKVLDFGLAKAMDPAAGTSNVADLARSPTLMNSPTLTGVHGTQLGVILGTAAYMAPEQARGGAVDKRADIWAFGVVVYEMLTGKSLFAGPTVSDTLAGVLKSAIDFAALPAGTPPAIRRLLQRCLERNPKNRLHDIADARLVIDDELAGRGDGLPPVGAALPVSSPPLWLRALPWLGGTVAGMVIGTLATLPASRASAPGAGPSASGASIRTLVAAGLSTHPSVSPDGRTLAFESQRDGVGKIWIKDLTSGSESPLVPHLSQLPAFSPDGTSVLFSAGEGEELDLFRISLATREERLVARAADEGDWAPDGKSVVFLRRTRVAGQEDRRVLVSADLEGGAERVLLSADGRQLHEPRWSPDGSRIALVLSSAQTGVTERLGLLDPATGKLEEISLEPLSRRGGKIQGIAWISVRQLALLVLDSGALISSSGRIALFDLASRQVSSLLPLASGGWGLDVAGKNSLIVGAGSTDQNLFEARRGVAGQRLEWGAPELATEGPFRDRQPVYSPDGKWLLFTSNRSGNLDVWRRDRTTGELRRLTDHEADDWDPALSPDGQRLLFSSNRTGKFQIWIAAADGSSPRQVTDLENAQNPTMTADGAWIVFGLQEAGADKDGIWKIRPDGTEATLVAADGSYLTPEISPEGRYVAMQSSGKQRLLRLADGALLDGDLGETSRFRWSVEAGRTYLWAIGTAAEGNEIRRYPFDADNGRLGPGQVVLADDAAGGAETFGVARDGSAVTFASLANRRGQLVRIDGLTSLEP